MGDHDSYSDYWLLAFSTPGLAAMRPTRLVRRARCARAADRSRLLEKQPARGQNARLEAGGRGSCAALILARIMKLGCPTQRPGPAGSFLAPLVR